MPVPKII